MGFILQEVAQSPVPLVAGSSKIELVINRCNQLGHIIPQRLGAPINSPASPFRNPNSLNKLYSCRDLWEGELPSGTSLTEGYERRGP